MIRLVALDQDTQAQTTLDLEGSPSISLNLAVAKPGETMQRHAPYSQTFRLPFSDKNNVFFAHFYEVTLSDGDFDPTQKTEVLIYEDGVQVIRGAMQLRAVRLMAEVYEVNVLGDVADLFAEMGSKLLQAAFLDGDDYTTEYNYNQTASNFVLSQTLTNSISIGDQVPDGTIIIPLADHGLSANQQPIVAQSNYGLMNANALGNGVQVEMLKPAMKLRVLVDLIIRTNGFSWTSDFFNSDLFGSLYMTLGSETERITTAPVGQCRAHLLNSQTYTVNTAWQIVPLDSTTSVNGFDDDGNFNTVTHAYICAQAGFHRFSGRARVRLNATGAGEEVEVIVRIMRGNISIGSATGTLTSAQSQIELSWIAEAVCTASQAVVMQVWFDGLAGGSDIEVRGIDGGGQEGPTYFNCLYAPGGQVDIPKLLPRIKQKDLMRDLCQRFNLVIEADPDNPRQLYIEPYADWIADGTDSYWTDKLDLDKERTLMPTSSIKSGRILFGDKDSGDVGNAFWKDTQGVNFGTYDQDIDDDFATGELKNDPVFAPYLVYTVPTLQGDPDTILTNVLIHRSYLKDGGGVKSAGQPPKLFFVTGLQDTIETLYVGGTAFTQYQFCSPFEEAPATSASQSLYWNSTDTPYSGDNALMTNGVPATGLHQSYWSSYLSDIYDADARVYEAHLYLTPSDIRNVRFNDRFHILGATYKLTEISGYQIGTGESTLCKFLRDLGRSSFGACDAVPSQSNANGTVTFTNADGTTTTDPGQACCEAFGYFYDAVNNVCRWGTPGTDEGDPVPPYPPSDPQDPIPSTNGDTPGPIAPTGTNTNTTDPDSGTTTVYDEVILTGETTGSGTTEPVAPFGAPITIGPDTLGVGVVRVISTTVGGSSGVAFTSKFETWRFLANGRAGTVTVSETAGEDMSYGMPGTRRLGASLTDGVLAFNVTGQADQIINWTLSVEMVRMYATNESEFENAILTESGARLAGINDRVLIQE